MARLEPVSSASGFTSTFPVIRFEGNALFCEPPQVQQYVFVDILRQNRARGVLDRVLTNRGKAKFECVWEQAEDKRWFCVFCLSIDGWESLIPADIAPLQGCVGFYFLPDSMHPASAS